MLTRRMRDVLACIEQSFAERGIAPTVKEMRLRIGMTSNSVVHDSLVRLEQRGFIRRLRRRERAIEVLRPLSAEPAVAYFIFDDEEKALKPWCEIGTTHKEKP